MKTPNNNDDYKNTVLKVQQQLQKELPVLQQNLNSLQATDNFSILPSIIHNICITSERQAYKFLKPAIELYLSAQAVNETIAEIIVNTSNTLKELQQKEDALQQEQYTQTKQEADFAYKNNQPYNINYEINNFNHLEADMASFYRKLIMLIISQQVIMNKKIDICFKHVKKMCIDILTSLIQQKQCTLNNTNKIIESQSK